jgi:hypothetical protein
MSKKLEKSWKKACRPPPFPWQAFFFFSPAIFAHQQLFI